MCHGNAGFCRLFDSGVGLPSLMYLYRDAMFNLKKLLTKKPDHPMANLREAKKLLADLPIQDAYKSLEEINFWLDSVKDAQGYRLPDRIEVLKYLDETAQPLQHKLLKDYLAAPRMNKIQENRLWLVLVEFWKRLTAAYLQCIEEFASGGLGANEIVDELPLMTLRAMRGLNAQSKMLHLRYRPVEGQMWNEACELFLLAEKKSFARNSMLPYAASSTTSVLQEFLKLLMVETSAPQSLSPLQIELAYRLADQYVVSFMFGDHIDKGCHFIDLSACKAPSKVGTDTRPHAMMRFFGAGSAPQKIQALIRQTTLGETPPELRLAGAAKKEDLLDLLKHLMQYWSATPPHRKHAREKRMSRLNLVHGMSEIRRKITLSPSDALPSVTANNDLIYQERLDLKLYGFITEKTKQIVVEAKAKVERIETEEERTESWVIENTSECGFGAVIPHLVEDWLKIGVLLGLRAEEDSNWQVGVVRRLSRDSQMKILVGIQLLAHEPVSVRLRPLIQAQSVWDIQTEAAAYEHLYGMLLTKDEHCGGESSLLLEPASVAPNGQYELLLRDEKYIIRITEVLEQGEGFERTGFAVVSE